MWDSAEERDSISNEHRNASDNKTLNQSSAQEPLNCGPSIDVEVIGATGSELRNDLGRWTRHLFNSDSASRRQVERAIAKDNDALFSIWPRPNLKNCLESVATHYNRIDACDEFVIAVGFTSLRRQKVEISVPPRNEAIEAGSDKDRCLHCGPF